LRAGSKKALGVSKKCPICEKEMVYEGNPFRPFCSERCKLIDLNNWLSGRYRMPVSSEKVAEATPAPAPLKDKAEDND
jgi:uncharacterized protein